MSFGGILKKILGGIYNVEHKIAPIAEVLLPGFSAEIAMADGLFGRLVQDVATAESVNSDEGMGGVKSQVVVANFEAQLEFTQKLLKASKQKLIYDAVALQDAINAQTLAYNKMAQVQASFQVVPLGP